jgi:hypothetical protein
MVPVQGSIMTIHRVGLRFKKGWMSVDLTMSPLLIMQL